MRIHSRRRVHTARLVGIGLALAPIAASAASFLPLGTLPGSFNSEALGVSPDGGTVVGRTTGGGSRPWFWTEATGLVELPSPGVAYGASDSGGVVVGATVTTQSGTDAFRWTEAGGIQAPGTFPNGARTAEAWDVSGDGSSVVGYFRDDSNQNRAFLWTETGGVVALGPTGYTGTYAHAISHDASTVVGRSGADAFRWDESSGFQPLELLPDGVSATALDVSLDGGEIAGWVQTGNGWMQAVRWTPSGAESIVADALDQVGWRSFAQTIDGDGDVIAGNYYFENHLGITTAGAFIWTPETGMQSLATILEALAIDIDGWSFSVITEVSLDGRTFVGHGGSPAGQREAFVVRLDSIPDVPNVPEPGTALLLGAGMAALAIRRRPV